MQVSRWNDLNTPLYENVNDLIHEYKRSDFNTEALVEDYQKGTFLKFLLTLLNIIMKHLSMKSRCASYVILFKLLHLFLVPQMMTRDSYILTKTKDKDQVCDILTRGDSLFAKHTIIDFKNIIVNDTSLPGQF